MSKILRAVICGVAAFMVVIPNKATTTSRYVNITVIECDIKVDQDISSL